MSAQGATQASVADALSLSQTAISRRLRGEIPFNVTELATLADMLDAPSLNPFATEAQS